MFQMIKPTQYDIIVMGYIWLFKYSALSNNVGTAGAQAVAEGLKHCTKFQTRDKVNCIDTYHSVSISVSMQGYRNFT